MQTNLTKVISHDLSCRFDFFDKNLITFDKEGNILISTSVDKASLTAMGISPDMKLRSPFDFEKYKPYLEHHWEEFYKLNNHWI